MIIAGVPSLFGGLNSLFGAVTLLTSDLPSAGRNIIGNTLGLFGTVWGIFDDNGNLVLEPDNITSLEFSKEWELLNYPVEQGAFETYNKVQVPSDISIRMTKGGTVSDRQAFLNTVETIAGDGNLYSVATPEVTYTSVNVRKYEYRRESNRGVGLLTVELKLMEVRVEGAQGFSNTASPAGADATNSGTVQALDDITDQQSTEVLDELE